MSTNEGSPQQQLVEKTFGREVLDYVLDGCQHLSLEDSAKAINHAVRTLDSLRIQAALADFPQEMAVSALDYQVTAPRELSVLNQLRPRQYDVPQPGADELLAHFNRYAYARFPYLLVEHHQRRQRGPLATTVSSSLYNNPARRLFEDSAMADAALMQLFGGRGEDAISTRTIVRESSGIERSIQLAVLTDYLVDTAFFLSHLQGSGSLEDFFQATAQVITMLRDAAVERRYEVPVVVLLQNVSLDDVGSMKLGDVMLQPWRNEFRAFVPEEARPGVHGGKYLGVLAVIDVALRVEVDQPQELDDSAGYRPGFDKLFQHSVAERVERIRLSGLLADESQTAPVATVESWRHVASIFSPSSYSYSRPPRVGAHKILTADDSATWSSYYRLLSDIDLSKVDIGVRRLLSAAADRENPTDGFIDAVVCWENLFGDSQGELRFRISCAMAALLEANDDRRLALQRKLKNLYDDRSARVHGGNVKREEDERDRRNSAIAYAVACLRRLVHDHPHLLQMPSSERTMRLVVGALGGQEH